MGEDQHAIERSEVLAAAGDLHQAAEQLKESARALTENSSEDRELLRITLAVPAWHLVAAVFMFAWLSPALEGAL